MEICKGIAVSPGVAIYPAVVMDDIDVRIPRRTVTPERIANQHQQITNAIESAKNELTQLREQVAADLGPEPAKIFDFHLGMLVDPSVTERIHETIDRESVTAESAWSMVMQNLVKAFTSQPNELFRERVSDVYDLEKRVLRHLLGSAREELTHLDHEAVIIAHDLTPSQTASMDTRWIKGMVTDAGGRTSHTAIVARAQGIPAIVAVENASQSVSTGDMVIVDGFRGLFIIDPDPQQLDEYQQYIERFRRFEAGLANLVDKPAVTVDGTEITLLANIEFSEEIPVALGKGAAGIGLYRTEFMFLSTESEPDEDQQYEAFRVAVELMQGRPLTIRTLDLGADKFTQGRMHEPERNPFLGCRSIRYCLQDLALFKSHLRAILRASVHGKIKLMFPLVTNMLELRQARMILHDVMEDLEEQQIPYDENIKVGIMIETPSAALMARVFTDEVDFFSIGTNDLTQYTLAVDRSNERVANLYSPAHPAVLKLIRDVIRAANRRNVEVTCCGEMAGELEFVMLLIGMGLRKLSMTPQSIPETKKLIRSVAVQQCERVARRVTSYDSERQVINYLREETKRIIPEAFDGRAVV